MTRTKLCDRVLPDYTKGEELFNTLSHSAGAVFGIVALLFIELYNGKRGFNIKYLTYLFYPIHLLALYGVCYFMGIAGIPAV